MIKPLCESDDHPLADNTLKKIRRRSCVGRLRRDSFDGGGGELSIVTSGEQMLHVMVKYFDPVIYLWQFQRHGDYLLHWEFVVNSMINHKLSIGELSASSDSAKYTSFNLNFACYQSTLKRS